MSPPTCATCRFFLDPECRRHQPVVVVRTNDRVENRWPTTEATDWCGDHDAKAWQELSESVSEAFGAELMKPQFKFGKNKS